jgi:3-isopropylmalate/(R)-2-methylmalate dehydratase small subunit
MVPVTLPEEQVNRIVDTAKAQPGYRLTVDLESCRLTDEEGVIIDFKMHDDPATHEFRRYCLLNGLDEIDLVFQHEDKIAAFEARRGPHGGVLTF